MKKNILYLLVLLVIVAFAIYLVKSKGSGSSLSDRVKDFSIEDTASISKVIITEKTGRILTLDKQENGIWVVNQNFRARKDVVGVLLETLKRVELKSPVNRTMRENVVKQIATSASKVQVYQDGKLRKVFYVGGATSDGTGTFMMLENAEDPFTVHIPGFDGYLSIRFNTDEKVWRDRELFRYSPENIDVIKIGYPQNPEASFMLKLEGRQYARLTNAKGDTATQIDAKFLQDYLLNYFDMQYESEISLRPGLKDSVLIAPNLQASILVFDKKGKENKAHFYERYFNGREFAPTGNEAEYDYERYFILKTDGRLFNGQKRNFDKLLIKYQDFLGTNTK